MQAIPHIHETDLDRWRKVLSSVSPRVEAAIDSANIQGGRQLVLHFRNALNSAFLAYAEGDASGFMDGCTKALDRFNRFFDPEFASALEERYVYEVIEEALCTALIARTEGAKLVAQQVMRFATDQSDARTHFVLALAALIRGERRLAEDIAGEMLRSPSLSHGEMLPKAIIAISQRDANGFSAYMQGAIDAFDRIAAADARGTPEAVVFLRGAALVRLYELANGERVVREGLDVRLLPAL